MISARSALHRLTFSALLALASAVAVAQGAPVPAAPELSAEALTQLRRVATDDPQMQRARWGDLALVAGKAWLQSVPGDVAAIWRDINWIVPGAAMRYHRGFCVAQQCQGTVYLVRWDEKAGQLEFLDQGQVSYIGRVQGDGSVRLAGTGLVGVFTAEALSFDRTSSILYSDKHELKPVAAAQLAAATRGIAGIAGNAGNATGIVPAASVAAPSATENERLRAELAEMKARMDRLSKQVDQQQQGTSAGGAAQKAVSPAEAREAERRAQREAKARAVEEQRQAADNRAREQAEAKARAAEEQRQATETRAREQAEAKARAAEEQRQAAETRAREQAEAKARAREDAQAKAAEAQRVNAEKRAREEDARRVAAESKTKAEEAKRLAAAESAKGPKTTNAVADTSQKYAALAIDRSKSFVYGFAFDQASPAAAEKRALDEVRKREGVGSVVLVWGGPGCGAYRTTGAGGASAYGWGLAATRMDAETTAEAEFLKRSRTSSETNAWACNSQKKGELQTVFDANNRDTWPMPFREGDLYGFRYKDGRILLTPQFSKAEPFSDGSPTLVVYPGKPGEERRNYLKVTGGFVFPEAQSGIHHIGAGLYRTGSISGKHPAKRLGLWDNIAGKQLVDNVMFDVRDYPGKSKPGRFTVFTRQLEAYGTELMKGVVPGYPNATTIYTKKIMTWHFVDLKDRSVLTETEIASDNNAQAKYFIDNVD